MGDSEAAHSVHGHSVGGEWRVERWKAKMNEYRGRGRVTRWKAQMTE